jgi:hypothetical protein
VLLERRLLLGKVLLQLVLLLRGALLRHQLLLLYQEGELELGGARRRAHKGPPRGRLGLRQRVRREALLLLLGVRLRERARVRLRDLGRREDGLVTARHRGVELH